MKLAWAMMAAVLSACSSSSLREKEALSSRAPAASEPSVEGHESSEQAFQALWGSRQAEAELGRRLERVAALFLRGQKLVMEFDALLEARVATGAKAGSREKEEAVRRKLAVVRVLQEEERDRLAFIHDRLLERSGGGEAEATRARQLMGAFWRQLGEDARSPRRLAYGDLLSELEDGFERFRASGPVQRASAEGLPISLSRLAFQSAGEVERFLDSRAPGGGLSISAAMAKAAEAEAARPDPDFERAFAELSREMDDAGRSPQSTTRLAPGSGREGNTHGHEFPRGTWALTYDDGPTQWTRGVLDALEEGGAKATFFWLARNLLRPASAVFVKEAKEAGHTLGNHSYHHKNFSHRGTSLDLEIDESTKVLTSVYGFRPRFFRCPFGSCMFPAVPRARRMIAALGMIHAQWNVDSLDYQDPDPRSIYRRVMLQMRERGRGIILFHDHKPQSAAVTRILLREYFKPNAATQRLVTMEEAVRLVNGAK